MSKIVGIIGGMGPLSTVELMRKVIEKTPVEKEQDHIRMLVDNRPEIPDRTDYLLGKGPSPVPMLQESAQLLEKGGAEILSISCNSAHAFIDQIREAINIPVLDMIDLVRIKLEQHSSAGAPIELLATTGTIHSRIYHKYLKDFTVIIPEPDIQEDLVMDAIYGEGGFKIAGASEKSRSKLLKAIEAMKQSHPEAIIAGCTEVELILKSAHTKLPVFYPLDILAERIVRLSSAQ